MDLFEKELSIYDSDWQICIPDWRIKMHYYLGLAYEQSRWYDKARREYEQFLDRWKDTDQGIPDVDDAKARVERLNAVGRGWAPANIISDR